MSAFGGKADIGLTVCNGDYAKPIRFSDGLDSNVGTRANQCREIGSPQHR
jgi:hypothetical protein